MFPRRRDRGASATAEDLYTRMAGARAGRDAAEGVGSADDDGRASARRPNVRSRTSVFYVYHHTSSSSYSSSVHRAGDGTAGRSDRGCRKIRDGHCRAPCAITRESVNAADAREMPDARPRERGRHAADPNGTPCTPVARLKVPSLERGESRDATRSPSSRGFAPASAGYGD